MWTDAEHARFRGKMAEVGSMLRGRRITPELCDSYRQALSGLSLDDALAGLSACARVCEWFPSPAEIRQTVAGRQAGARKTVGREDCPSCLGTGFIRLECPGTGACGSEFCKVKGQPHGLMRRCPCRTHVSPSTRSTG